MQQETTFQQTDITILQGRLREMSKHMSFVGMFCIIYGALACLSIIGAIIGIPYIIAGLRIRESADSYLGFSKSSDARQLLTAFEKQSSFFFIMKVLIIIALVLFALYLIFLVGFLSFVGSDFLNELDNF
jgi:tetrahydromethanopterin S-methyltransferase subunit C